MMEDLMSSSVGSEVRVILAVHKLGPLSLIESMWAAIRRRFEQLLIMARSLRCTLLKADPQAERCSIVDIGRRCLLAAKALTELPSTISRTVGFIRENSIP